ncbi:hypothetical protein SAMN06295974_1592 [Plantibacter flavus]|uniref:Uncharacterized protein n=1 Tax=Plantibacter flavus TaxID=150123 RepID=A0A3N2C7N0_9MICO|nr:hypothetical protein EDD42_3635 [Plantibacter flavus]SMG24369.1 hypothetical protein SAMN06295974_1592 [Plantibacter flavus]
MVKGRDRVVKGRDRQVKGRDRQVKGMDQQVGYQMVTRSSGASHAASDSVTPNAS